MFSSLFFFFFFFFKKNFLTDLLFIQHYDRRGQYDIALSKIDEAIEHTPTVIDLYSIKVC
jgi:hypothetical protein